MSSPGSVQLSDIEESLQTPTISNFNVADAYDWRHRANVAEQELSIQSTKLAREKRRARRLESQIAEYVQALTRSTQNCTQTINNCQHLYNTNLALSRDLAKAKCMVETLEAVIMMLHDKTGGASQ